MKCSGGVGRGDAGDGNGATGPVREGKTTWAAGVRMRPDRPLRAPGDPACALPGGLVPVAGGMRGEGRQVGHHRQVGQASAPAPEIVPRVVPVGPGHVEGPVPGPPSGASAGGGFDDVGVRDEAVAAGHLAVGFGGPTSGRMTRSASAPSCGGGSAIRRYRWGRFAEPRPAVRWVSCGIVPCRYSPGVARPDGLRTKMRLPPARRGHGNPRLLFPGSGTGGRGPADQFLECGHGLLVAPVLGLALLR